LNPSEETIHCDINRARDVIGPGGATVKEIQAQTGARVNINTRVNPCSITISGTQEALQAAGEIINGIMNPPSQVLSCDPGQVREVIGPGGSIVNGIQDQTGARIEVDSNVNPCTITITGTDESIQAAAMVITEIINRS
jgi:polyribonucleotide nucleotidyltransferase